jgi:hypothetical protein
MAIRYPGGEQRTLKVAVTMRKEMFSPVVVATQSVDKVIDWPDFTTFVRNQLLRGRQLALVGAPGFSIGVCSPEG